MQDITDSNFNLNVLAMNISFMISYSLLYNYRTNNFYSDYKNTKIMSQ